MGVGEAGVHRGALEVDHPGGGAEMPPRVAVGTYEDDSAALEGHRLRFGLFVIGGVHLGVAKHQIRRFLRGERGDGEGQQ